MGRHTGERVGRPAGFSAVSLVFLVPALLYVAGCGQASGVFRCLIGLSCSCIAGCCWLFNTTALLACNELQKQKIKRFL